MKGRRALRTLRVAASSSREDPRRAALAADGGAAVRGRGSGRWRRVRGSPFQARGQPVSPPPPGSSGPCRRGGPVCRWADGASALGRVLTRFVQKYTVKGLGGAGSSISTSNSRPRDQPRRRQRDLVARTARVGREVRRRAQRLRALYRCASRAAAAVVGTQGKGASLGCARRSRSRCERPAAQSTGLSMEWGLGGIF